MTDFIMPGISGEELISAARAAHPRIGAIVLSGFAYRSDNPDTDSVEPDTRDGTSFLSKGDEDFEARLVAGIREGCTK